MKKFILAAALVLTGTLCRAAVVSINAPVSVTNTGVTLSSSTLVAQTGGLQNCINNATLMSTVTSNMAIIDGALVNGTTLWQIISAPANTPIYPVSLAINPVAFGSGDGFCGGANSPLVVYISSGTKSINYNSFIRK